MHGLGRLSEAWLELMHGLGGFNVAWLGLAWSMALMMGFLNGQISEQVAVLGLMEYCMEHGLISSFIDPKLVSAFISAHVAMVGS